MSLPATKEEVLSMVERATKEYLATHDGDLDDLPLDDHADGITFILGQIIDDTWVLSTDPMAVHIAAMINDADISGEGPVRLLAREIVQMFVGEGWVGPNQNRKD